MNTTADTANRLSVAAPATLPNHEGEGHHLKLNKASAKDTASLLYQTRFSGRAEMGLAGDDAFAIKVSADGAAWQEALRVDPASARVALDQPLAGLAVTQGPSDTTDDRVIRAQDGYVKGSLLGTVTQICDSIVTAAFSTIEKLGVRWTFPAKFLEMPNCNAMLWVGTMTTEMTPPISDITGVMRGASSSNSCDFVVYRVTGGTNFIAGDTTPIQVTAIGRWF